MTPTKRAQLIPRLGLTISILLATACIQVDARSDFDRARRLIEASTGRNEVFEPDSPALSSDEIAAVLADGLSLDEALRLALVNNRELQAEFQEIGIAQADWVQSQLLSNPSLDVLLWFPSGGGRTLLEAVIGVELLELWRIPVREHAARHHLEATVLRIARRSGEYLADARSAYYSAVAAAELQLVARDNVELASRSFTAVKELHEAGAADALDENLARGPLLAARLALQRARMEASDAKRELAKRLSIARPVTDLLLIDALPKTLTPQQESEVLVQQALGSRLDLQSIEAAIKALDTHVRLEEHKAWGDVLAGPGVERPAGGEGKLVGPSLSLTLPIFDQNQAQVARAAFELEKMVKLYESAVIAVAQNVRSGIDRLNTASQNLTFYGAELLPQAEHSLALAEEAYTAGQSSLTALIEAQRHLLEIRGAHVTLRLEAAVSFSELERSLGSLLR